MNPGGRQAGQRVEVQRYDPRQRATKRVITGLATLILLGMTYWAGGLGRRDHPAERVGANAGFEGQVSAAATRELQNLKQQVTNLETSLEIERAAASQVRSSLASATAGVARLQQEVELYRSLMDSSVRTRGLTLHRLELQQNESPGGYRYRITLLQRATHHVELAGTLDLSIGGTIDGKPRALKLSDVAVPASAGRIPLKLVYFQFIEGEFRLPAGFEPKDIRVLAEVSRGRTQRLDVKREWVIGGT